MHEVETWSLELLGTKTTEVLFGGGHLSAVYGVRLEDGTTAALKARLPQPRIRQCVDVQWRLWETGFPCPKPLAGPTVIGEKMVTAEEWVPGGAQLARDEAAPSRFADLLAKLIGSAPSPGEIESLDPAPPWIAWDHHDGGLWPRPDDADTDLNAIDGPRWLDEAAMAIRDRLAEYRAEVVVGHGDWESQNIRWIGTRPHVVYDWDSVVSRPEAALAGVAAAVFPASGKPGAATVEETRRFIDAYQDVRGITWSRDHIAAAWAAGAWVRAFNAKKRVARRLPSDPDLTPEEAAERLRRGRP